MTLNDAQRMTAMDYSGTITSTRVATGEYSDERTFGHAVEITFSTGWVVKVGRYGAVLDETPPVPCTCGADSLTREDQVTWTPSAPVGHLAYCNGTSRGWRD